MPSTWAACSAGAARGPTGLRARPARPGALAGARGQGRGPGARAPAGGRDRGLHRWRGTTRDVDGGVAGEPGWGGSGRGADRERLAPRSRPGPLRGGDPLAAGLRRGEGPAKGSTDRDRGRLPGPARAGPVQDHDDERLHGRPAPDPGAERGRLPRGHRRHASLPWQQPQRLAGPGRLRAAGREAVRRGRLRSLPAGVRHRAGGGLRAAPLRPTGQDRGAGAGLVQGAAARVPDEPRRRIEEAARYLPLEQLALSPRCGVASTAPGNLLTVDEQRRKLELVVETARKVWG
jgi:hypothetical protein